MKKAENWLKVEYIFYLFGILDAVYFADLNGKPDLNKIYVDITLFGKKSWINLYIKRYKQFHPEEFEKDMSQ